MNHHGLSSPRSLFFDKRTQRSVDKRNHFSSSLKASNETIVLEETCIFVLFIHYVTKFGENLFCCVSSQLGDLLDNPEECVMQWTENHYWRIVLQVQKNRPLYYHFCMKGPNGQIIRESITRILQHSSKASQCDIRLVEDVWQKNRHLNIVEPQHQIFVSQKPKQEISLPKNESEFRKRLREQEYKMETLMKELNHLKEEKNKLNEEKNLALKQNQELTQELKDNKTILNEMEEKLNFHMGLDLHKMNLNVLEEHDKTIHQYSETIHQYYISRLKQQTEAKLCVCCCDKPVNVVVSPCQHACMCFECATHVQRGGSSCPICRKTIRQVQKIFL